MENTMTTITAPAPQANTTPKININTPNTNESPINLFQLGCLFVIRASYWSCRIGNDPGDFHLAPDEVESKAIAIVRLEGADRSAQRPQAASSRGDSLSADREEGPPPARQVLEAVPRG
jgi:hypothetical protein